MVFLMARKQGNEIALNFKTPRHPRNAKVEDDDPDEEDVECPTRCMAPQRHEGEEVQSHTPNLPNNIPSDAERMWWASWLWGSSLSILPQSGALPLGIVGHAQSIV